MKLHYAWNATDDMVFLTDPSESVLSKWSNSSKLDLHVPDLGLITPVNYINMLIDCNINVAPIELWFLVGYKRTKLYGPFTSREVCEFEIESNPNLAIVDNCYMRRYIPARGVVTKYILTSIRDTLIADKEQSAATEI